MPSKKYYFRLNLNLSIFDIFFLFTYIILTMPKAKSSGKGFIRVSKAKKSKSKRNSKVRKQRGGRVTLPKAYFEAGNNNHYHNPNASDVVNPMAVSQGNSNGTTDSVGPDLHPHAAFGQMKGGGVLPSEYFGGNSGRYFAAGSPELENCSNAYGIAFPSSHGVVMPGENANFMGPQLAASPNWLDMTGGGRRGRRVRRKSVKPKKSKKNSKSRVRKSRKTQKNKKRRK